MSADRTVSKAEREIEHGAFLAAEGPEAVWGWGTSAGKVRAARRGVLIAEAAKLSPGKRVLEVGCGTGNFTETFARYGCDIIAVDISPALIELAHKRQVPRTVRWICKRFEDAEVDGPFDAVIDSSVLHHLDIQAALPKLLGLLKAGGKFSFAEPNMLNPQIAVQKNIAWIKRRLGDSPDETAFVRFQFRSLLMQAGFVDVRITPFDWLHPETPEALISVVQRLGGWAERTPILRELAGSLLLTAERAV